MRAVAIVGGGPAGMMAALAAARAGACVTLLEKNEKLGKKLYITGKGRCNVTNMAPRDEFLQHVPRNPRFLYSALAHLSAGDLRAMLERYGTPTKEERGARVFPASDKASDVTRALDRALEEAGVSVRLDAPVRRVLLQGEAVCGVELADGTSLAADAVVVATGGASYPGTGSTGDGYRFAQEASLPVLPPRPSLVGLHTAEGWPAELQGLTLKNVALRASIRGKRVMNEMGELLFTHFGVSGPLALTLSALAADADLAEVAASIDLKPGMSEQEVDERLTRELAASPRKALSTLLEGWLPRRMAALFPQMCGLPAGIVCNAVSRTTRMAVGAHLKGLPFTLSALRPIAEAVITRGGVDVSALDSRSMAAKSVRGLYFAGEVIDVDALTGGYNLHIAFSTGYLAGTSAAKGALDAAPRIDQAKE